MFPLRLPTSALGPLETQVMEVVWSRADESSVRDVKDLLPGEPAYTTVMTTLDRLYKKGLLSRRRDGRGFVYTAHVSRSDLSSHLIGTVVLASLGTGSAHRPILSAIVEAVGESDAANLDELERLVRLKRRALEGDER
jgi:predicted transcriptional regulator